MRVLVTGAGGFIGAHVVRELVAAGHEVHGVVRPGSSSRALDGLGMRDELAVDLLDSAAARSALRSVRPDALVHLAWYAEPGRYLHDEERNDAWLRASVDLLRAAAEAGSWRIVVAGTCLEHGAGDSPYARAKRALHREAFGLPGTAAACAQVFYLYGPGEDPRRVVPWVVQTLLRGERAPTTDGLQRRDYLHVADVAAAFRALAESSVTGGVDICSGRTVMLREVLLAVAQELGRPELLDLGALDPPEDRGHEAPGDPSVLLDLGWRPRFELRTGITDTVRWWRGQAVAA